MLAPEQETTVFNFIIEKSLLNLINQYRFAHCLESKADAIRTLLRIALRSEGLLPPT